MRYAKERFGCAVELFRKFFEKPNKEHRPFIGEEPNGMHWARITRRFG